MGVVFSFAGQGAQLPGMIAALPSSDAVTDTLAAAQAVLGHDPAALDDAERLADTQAVQQALTIVGVAGARHLLAEGAGPDAVMGLSIGAWPAAVIAGAIEFADALALVGERGALMRDAYPSGYGMSAVIGLGAERVQELVDTEQRDGACLFVGNINSDDQIVVAGDEGGLARLDRIARAAGAQRVRRLDMNVPSHCALLDAPAQALERAADPALFRTPKLAYYSANARRRLWRAEDVRDDLIWNMARTVHWAASARIVHESGYDLAVEMPPARVLTGLHPAMDSPGEAVAVVDAGWHNAAALIRRAASMAD
jgi:malonate decarboxylase epsilon subunit